MMPGTSHRLIAAGLLLLLCLASLCLVARHGHQARVAGRPLAIAAAAATLVRLPQPVDILEFWRAKGFHGRIVVNLTGHWQPVVIANERLDGVRYPLPLKNLARERLKTLSDDNVLFVAAALGVARRIVTILPDDGYRQRRELARSIKTFTDHNSSFTLYFQGFAREFTTLDAFHAPQEPVLLLIEESFLQGRPLGEVLQRLETAGMVTDCLVLISAARDSSGAGGGL